METAIEYLRKMGKEKRQENQEFKAFLLSGAVDRGVILDMVVRLNEEVSAEITCCGCGNCCKELSPLLSGPEDPDLRRLARGLEMTPEAFMDQYMMPAMDGEKGYYFNQLPCPFLTEEKCTVYSHRTVVCRQYPYFHTHDFFSHLDQTLDSCSICPMIYHVVEKLKAMIWNRAIIESLPAAAQETCSKTERVA